MASVYVKHKLLHQTFERMSKSNDMHDVEVIASVNLRSHDPAHMTFGLSYWFGENTEPSTEAEYDEQLATVRARLERRARPR